MKMIQDDGSEIDVFTADEVSAREVAAAEAATGKLKPDLDKSAAEVTRLETLLKNRAQDFAAFRTLSEEQVAKLDEKDRIIYENQVQLKNATDQRIADAAAAQKVVITNAIKAKAGDNAKLVERMTEMYDLIGVKAETPEQIEAKVLMTLGAIGTATPDLVASVNGFSGGSYAPPVVPGNDGKSFADTEQGKAGASELGLTLEAKK
jgi:hypothetical protein